MGLCNIEILSADGDVLLDAGYKEIRGVRRVENDGVEVWVTPASAHDPLRQRRWIHKVSEHAAHHLEDLWLNSSPITHSGVAMTHLHWREDEYAYSVGRVITEAAKCDVSLAGLAIAGRSILGESTEGVLGQSGEPLADMLDKIGSHSEAVADIAERYRVWYAWRNFATHGVRERDSSGRATDQVFKARRGTKGQRSTEAAVTVDAHEQDFHNLALTWHAFNALNHDASRAQIHLRTRERSERVLRELPMPNSVNEHRRPPPTS